MMKIELCVCYIFQIFSLQKSNHSTFQNKLIKTENVPHGLVHNNLDSNIIVTMGSPTALSHPEILFETQAVASCG